MKKLMALCLAAVMALSMCAFTVMAEETAVDFSAIANGQPANFVTSNLVLGENTITSSNEAVIATDGTVTRPIYEDATVSLTINGGEAVEVTVKAKTANALYSTDFSTDSTPASKKFPGYDEWYFGNDITNDTAISGGKLNADHGTSADDDAGYMYLYYRPATISGTRPVTFSFEINDVASLSVGIDIRLAGTKYDAEGNKVGEFSNQTVMTMRSGNKFYGYGTGHDAAAKNPASIKYNPATGEFWLNETKATVSLFDKGTTNEGATVSKVVITNILFVDAASTARGLYSIDNFVQYEDVPAEEALASATPAEMLANYSTLLDKDYVANGGNLDALTGNLKFTADEELPADVELSWTSTNPAIASDGTVKRPILEAATATITGTLKVGEESISKSYNVTILPATIAGQSETVNFDTVGSVSDFTLISGGSGTVVTEAGNKVGSFTYSGSMSTYATYNFETLPSLTNAQELIMEFKLRTENHSTAGTSNVTNYGFKVNNSEIAEFINYSGVIRVNNTYNGAGAANAWHGSGPKSVTYNTNSADYATFKIVVDVANKTAKHYLNGTQIGDVTVGIGLASLDSITSLSFYLADRSSGATIYVDDISVHTTQSPNSVISNLGDADKVAFYKELIETSEIGAATSVGTVLDLDNGYADYNPATYGAAVNWTSDNTAYIANDGTVAKLAPFGENVTVNMTATITAGNATDTVVIPVAIADITSVDTALHYAYDFTDYTAPDGAAYEIVTDEDAAHGNVLKLDSTVGTSATIAHTQYGDGTRKDRFVIETDFKYDSASTGYPYFTVTTSAGAAGIRVYVNYSTGKVGLLTTKAALSNYDFAASGSQVIYFDMPESVKAKKGEWTHLLIDYNALSETYQVSIDGIVINEIPVLNAAIVPTRTGGSVRHILYQHSGTGVLYADNLSLKDYDDDNVIEVNAALNAALTLYASEIIHPALSNRTLWDKGIGLSWTNGTVFYTDASDLGNNPAGYKAVEDGPALTYKIGDNAVTAINVVSPTEAEITITATKNGYSESKTFTRKLAPVVIETLSLGTENCLNGVWAEGATGTEKMILAKYLGGKIVEAEVIDFTVVKDTGSRYDAATGFVKDLAGYTNPKVTAAYDQIKIFVVDADGITPLAFMNSELHD